VIGWEIDVMTNGQLRGVPKNGVQWIAGLFVLPLMLLLTSRRVRGILFRVGKPHDSRTIETLPK